QLGPDAGFVPELRIVPARLAAAAAEFGGQIVPGDAGLENEQDAGENLAVIQGLASGEAEAALGRGRQQGLEPFPQSIRNQGLHGRCSFSDQRQSLSHQAAVPVPNNSFFPYALSLTFATIRRVVISVTGSGGGC